MTKTHMTILWLKSNNNPSGLVCYDVLTTQVSYSSIWNVDMILPSVDSIMSELMSEFNTEYTEHLVRLRDMLEGYQRG